MVCLCYSHLLKAEVLNGRWYNATGPCQIAFMPKKDKNELVDDAFSCYSKEERGKKRILKESNNAPDMSR